eukprot:4437575-Amphidinium_carterae.1
MFRGGLPLSALPIKDGSEGVEPKLLSSLPAQSKNFHDCFLNRKRTGGGILDLRSIALPQTTCADQMQNF